MMGSSPIIKPPEPYLAGQNATTEPEDITKEYERWPRLRFGATIDAEVVRSQEIRYKYMLDSVNNGLNDNY